MFRHKDVFCSPQYDIVGHSGDGHNIELVRADKVPKNNKDRLKVLKVQTCHIHLVMFLSCVQAF